MLWQPMSDSTPPPWRVGSQNQALWGPACSSPDRARTSGPIARAVASSWARALVIAFMWIWFSKYAVGTPSPSASSTMRRASARLRPKGFSMMSPFRWSPPAATSSMTASRQSLGAKTATTSTWGTIPVTES